MNVQSLQNEVRTKRAALRGKTFAECPDAFIELEASKVRANVATDPLFYTHQHEAFDAKRRERFEKRKGRKSA